MFKSPRAIPPISMLMSDLAARPSDVSRHLSVTERTVWAWKAADSAPRSAMLALYWETRWGRSQIETDTYNEAQVHREHAKSLMRENERLRGVIAALEQHHNDTANTPFFDLTEVVNKR